MCGKLLNNLYLVITSVGFLVGEINFNNSTCQPRNNPPSYCDNMCKPWLFSPYVRCECYYSLAGWRCIILFIVKYRQVRPRGLCRCYLGCSCTLLGTIKQQISKYFIPTLRAGTLSRKFEIFIFDKTKQPCHIRWLNNSKFWKRFLFRVIPPLCFVGFY